MPQYIQMVLPCHMQQFPESGSILVFANSERGQIWIQLAELHPRADVFEVLVPPLVFLHVSCEVGIHNAHTSVMELKSYGNTTFVTLKDKDKDISQKLLHNR